MVEPIYSYTDKQAVEDGFLVALTAKDRVTRAVFDYLAEKAPAGAQPPTTWPVDVAGWFSSNSALARAKALALGLTAGFGLRARRVYEKNIGGGILVLYAIEDAGKLVALSEQAPAGGVFRKLWLLPNELGGLTLMFPEDY